MYQDKLLEALQRTVWKGYQRDTQRVCEPEATLLDCGRYFPELGITRMADLTGLDTVGIPVTMAVRPNAKAFAVSRGKGVSLTQAKVSAAMKAAAIYHGEEATPKIVKGSYNKLRSHYWLPDPQLFPWLSSEGFLADREQAWALSYDLLGGRDVLIPLDTVHCDMRLTRARRASLRIQPYGLAAGNHLLEALIHGLCHVIEQDAVHLWRARVRLGGEPPPRLDLQSVTDEDVGVLLNHLQARGFQIASWSMGAAVGVPVIGVALMKMDKSGALVVDEPVFPGYCCHLNPCVALIQAVCKAARARMGYIAGARGDRLRAEFRELVSFRNQRFLKKQSQEVDKLTVLPANMAATSFNEDLETLLKALKLGGFPYAAVVDLTKPELGLPVARVVLPGAVLAWRDDLIHHRRAQAFAGKISK